MAHAYLVLSPHYPAEAFSWAQGAVIQIPIYYSLYPPVFLRRAWVFLSLILSHLIKTLTWASLLFPEQPRHLPDLLAEIFAWARLPSTCPLRVLALLRYRHFSLRVPYI